MAKHKTSSFTKNVRFLIVFSLFYVAVFTIYYVSIRNYEFLWYVAVLVFFLVLILATLRRSKFDNVVLWGLSLWGLLHMAGGGVLVQGEVLYKLQLIPLISSGEMTILRFDQFVHFFGFGVATLVGYHLLEPYLNNKPNYAVVYPLVVAIGMGLGALNEIVEFVAVVTFPETDVGGYFNTSLDLVFNMFGAVAAVGFIHMRRRK